MVRAADLIAILRQPASKGAFIEFKDFLFAPVTRAEN